MSQYRSRTKGVLLTTLLALFTLLAGCATTYNSLGQSADGKPTLVLAPEDAMVAASFEAITQIFPSANVQPLPKPLLGFSWFHMPLLDRTDFRFLITRRSGQLADGSTVTGWSYNIVTHGTQGLVEARYVNPLVKTLTAILRDRNYAEVPVSKVTYEAATADSSPKTKGAVASGTGFFVTRNGHIISNYHVIANATHVEVRDSTGKVARAKVISTDPSNDVALLKIEADSVPLTLRPSTVARKGGEVFTLGYPLVSIQGQEQKVTFGRINALSGIQGDIRYLQVDVPIQPGNSGGPLITEEGYVVAVVTATLNQLGTLKATGTLPQSVNYAVKSEYFLPLLQYAKLDLPLDKASVGSIRDTSVFERSVVQVVARQQ